MDTLEIFDFDWTLFRSPDVPEGEPRKPFIHHPRSLEPPHVPIRPDEEFWIEEIVSELRDAQRRPDSLTVVLTARRAKTEDRIMELLHQRLLDPDIVLFRSAAFHKDKNRVNFKRRMALKLLRDNPTVTKMVVWEDEEEQIKSLRDLAKRKKIKFEGNLVADPGRPKQKKKESKNGRRK